MIFEIHMTGDSSIHKVGKRLNHKTIKILNLTPRGDIHSIHHMTSIQKDFVGKDECFKWLDRVKLDYNPIRTKVECPPYDEYMAEAIYVESHIKIKDFKESPYPVSMNAKSSSKLITAREYNKEMFGFFCDFYKKCHAEVELCIMDDNVKLDESWFNLYEDDRSGKLK